MAMNRFTRMLVKMAGIEKEMEWISAERVNIMLTAVLPTLLGVVGLFVQAISKGKLEVFKQTMSDEVFTHSIQLLLIICALYVLYKIGDRQHFDANREGRLRDYIMNEANMHDKSKDSIDIVVQIIKDTVSKFYTRWKILWIVFLVYYAGNLFFIILKRNWVEYDPFVFSVVNNVFNNVLNFASSCAMFWVFMKLNSGTISKQEKDIYRYGVTSSYFFMGVFAFVVIVLTLFSLSLPASSYYCFQMGISFVLSVYSALSFVFLLGKLNSTYLHIPRLIFYGLYFYAIAQMCQFLLVEKEARLWISMPCGMEENMNNLMIGFQYATFVGKILLTLVLTWIMYGSRFVCYIVQRSIEISESEYTKQVFKSYFTF